MSNYDDWKLESDIDQAHRLMTHYHGPSSLPPAVGGFCKCGAETTRSMAGVDWQCKPCAEIAMRKKVEAA